MTIPKRILFITTANLTTNPRLLKELKFLSKEHQCTFLGFQLGNWADVLDEGHKHELPDVEFHYISATRKPLFPWLCSGIIQKVARFIYPVFKRSPGVVVVASNKRSWLLTRYLARHKIHVDLIIAHTLGALYPARIFERKQGIPFAFDIEDYHPGEKISFDAINEKQRREFLMQQLLPSAAFVSYASPLIGQASLHLVGENKLKHHFLIHNSFASSEFVKPEEGMGKLKLVWFSQYVDAGRGLELLLPVLDQHSERLELHLIGSPRPAFVNKHIKHRKYIILHGTMLQKGLHRVLANFDVGLALESITQDQNRDICLTNKLWAYVQSGLFVLATDTLAQKQFMEEYPWTGTIVKQYEEGIAQKLRWIIDHIEDIRTERQVRYEKAKQLGWEMEREKLIKEIDQVLEL